MYWTKKLKLKLKMVGSSKRKYTLAMSLTASCYPFVLRIPARCKSSIRSWFNIWSFRTEFSYFNPFCKRFLGWIAISKTFYTVHFMSRPIVDEHLSVTNTDHETLHRIPVFFSRKGKYNLAQTLSWNLLFSPTSSANCASSEGLKWGKWNFARFLRAEHVGENELCGGGVK